MKPEDIIDAIITALIRGIHRVSNARVIEANFVTLRLIQLAAKASPSAIQIPANSKGQFLHFRGLPLMPSPSRPDFEVAIIGSGHEEKGEEDAWVCLHSVSLRPLFDGE